MKKIAVLYSITLIAGVALILGINHWTTATHRTPIQQVPAQHQPVETKTSISETGTPETVATTETPRMKKRPCHCCAERMARMAEQIKKARERKQRENSAGVQASVSKENGKAK